MSLFSPWSAEKSVDGATLHDKAKHIVFILFVSFPRLECNSVVAMGHLKRYGAIRLLLKLDDNTVCYAGPGLESKEHEMMEKCSIKLGPTRAHKSTREKVRVVRCDLPGME